MEESNQTNLYGRLMLSIEGTSLSSLETKLISNPHVGGVIFFSHPIKKTINSKVNKWIFFIYSLIVLLLPEKFPEGKSIIN